MKHGKSYTQIKERSYKIGVALEKINIIGKQYNRLTPVERVENTYTKSGHEIINYLCKCDCGNELVVNKHSITSGNTKSCGCLRKEKSKETKYFKGNKYELIEEGYIVGYTTNTNDIFYIDFDFFDIAIKYSWMENSNGYIRSNTFGEQVYLHKLIMPEDGVVDHINGNRKDCRVLNMRYVTMLENAWNSGVSKRSETGTRGVIIRANRYESAIIYKGETIRLGRYELLEDAIKARKDAEEKYFKEYIRR